MDVKKLLEDNNVQYKSATKDYVIHCLNPDHIDGTPSCNVDKLSGIFNCWSCTFSGNIYTHFNKEIPHIIHQRSESLRNKILKLMWSKPMQMPLVYDKWTTEFRDISAKTLEHFNAFSTEEIGMEGRIVFPITNISGDILSVTGRYVHSDLHPKYKNYPEHTEVGMFPQAVNHNGSMNLVEGIFDMLNLYDKGLDNTVMCSGINMGLVRKKHKRELNVEKLLKYKIQGIDSINIIFDGDEAGRKAAKGLSSYIDEIFIVKVIDLPDGKDPGSLTQKEVDKLREVLI